MLKDRQDAHRLLKKLGASERLLTHLLLVGEAASELTEQLDRAGIKFNANLVELGVAVHDAGKIKFPAELDGPGSNHEPAGEQLMLANGVQPEVAHCCVSHAAWQASDVSFEERLVALSDKLWKGKREESLELLVIDEAAARLGKSRWDLFPELDSAFEAIAAEGPSRLERSRKPST
jgi:hypothetical protein